MRNTSTCCGTPAGEPGDVEFFPFFATTLCIADPGVDALEFRTTRSGRVFSEWAEISARTFDIAMAVAHSIQLNHGHDENLAELDSGPPTLALATIQPATGSTSAISMPPKTRRDRDKARSKLKRQAERMAAKAKTDILLDARPRHPRHLSKPISPIKATFEMRKVRIASTGWIGLRDDGVAPEEDEDDAESGPSPTRTLPDFFGPSATLHGFTYVPYDSPEARPIVDAKQKVCGVFGGMPDDPNFMRDVHDPAVEAMEDARTCASIAEERMFHRRGNYAQLTGGNSYGGGQFEPGELVNGAINAAIFASLISNIAFIRLAGFATGLFANWAPNLFDFYVDYMWLFYKRCEAGACATPCTPPHGPFNRALDENPTVPIQPSTSLAPPARLVTTLDGRPHHPNSALALAPHLQARHHALRPTRVVQTSQ
ncbi:hypothetical protein B0H13DRAFT_2328075 [Mycena leptocephala]|nr:hypothetical protein B0H13DRAFT_2328075 [Mycena leptocephala]